MIPEAWLRYQQSLILSAFVAGCTVAELQLRLLQNFPSSISLAPDRPAVRLVSDMFGLYVEKDRS